MLYVYDVINFGLTGLELNACFTFVLLTSTFLLDFHARRHVHRTYLSLTVKLSSEDC